MVSALLGGLTALACFSMGYVVGSSSEQGRWGPADEAATTSSPAVPAQVFDRLLDRSGLEPSWGDVRPTREGAPQALSGLGRSSLRMAMESYAAWVGSPVELSREGDDATSDPLVLLGDDGTGVASPDLRDDVRAGGGPLPAVAPSPGSLTEAEMRALLAGSPWPPSTWNEVLRIAGRESGWNPNAVGAASEVGLLQLHPIHADWIADLGIEWSEVFDPAVNLYVAWHLFEKEGWGPWSTR